MTEKKLSPAEARKENSGHLRGNLREELAVDSTHFNKEDIELLKFHGSYQQDDRDTRMQRIKAKEEKDFIMMVRSKIPGGKMNAGQYLAHDELADRYGNRTLRVTTRQGLQFHGVLKKNLKAVIQGINEKLGTTSGACGDIVRNVMACPAPLKDRRRMQIMRYAKELSDQFLSKSNAYNEIWLDGEKVSSLEEEEEPVYGKTYLPRKFKIAVACPEDNCVDVYTNDLGIVPELDTQGELTGFNLLVGGGLGMTHGLARTYPRLATPLCFVKPEDLLAAARAVVIVQRDNGNRSDRKRARLKYLLDEKGIDWFRAEMEKHLGKKTEPAHEISLREVDNHLGWQPQGDGKYIYGISVENGRIQDAGDRRLKSALRRLVEDLQPEVYLTAQHDVLLGGLAEGDKEKIDSVLAEYGVPLPGEVSNMRRDSMACPALPTCGLAMTESERIFPSVIDEFESYARELGLDGQKFIIRMTGCPNGCARPYNAEIAFVGRGANLYNIYVGGNLIGDRLASLLVEKVALKDLASTVRPLLEQYREKRHDGEGFGDFSRRIGVDSLKTQLSN